eukprot:4650476-Pleurochrysis_carterae.AAC.2
MRRDKEGSMSVSNAARTPYELLHQLTHLDVTTLGSFLVLRQVVPRTRLAKAQEVHDLAFLSVTVSVWPKSTPLGVHDHGYTRLVAARAGTGSRHLKLKVT